MDFLAPSSGHPGVRADGTVRSGHNRGLDAPSRRTSSYTLAAIVVAGEMAWVNAARAGLGEKS